MRRREFLTTLCGAVAASPAARAQRRIPHVGYLGTDTSYLQVFEAGLRDVGYVPGDTIEIESRFGAGEQEMVKLARELVNLRVDVIVTNGAGVFGAHEVTKTVPIVAASAADLVLLGYADSLAHPGGNVTGQTFFYSEVIAKRIELLKRIRPALTSVGLLLVQGRSSNPILLRTLIAPILALGVDLTPIEVLAWGDCDRRLSANPGASIGGIIISDAPEFLESSATTAIAAAAARHGKLSAGAPSFARNGGLLGYGVEFTAMYRHAATFVDKILRGEKPGDIPIEQATKFKTIVNLKIAAALGLEIPSTLLAAADEVIE